MPLAIEMDEAFNPVELSLLDAQAVVFDADAVADAIEETGETSAPFHIDLSAPLVEPRSLILRRLACAGHQTFLRLTPCLPSFRFPIFRWAAKLPLLQ
jgi:hypothetical protein